MGLLNAIVPEDALLDKAFEYAAALPRMRPSRPSHQTQRAGSLKSTCVRRTRSRHGSPRDLHDRGRQGGARAFAEKRQPKWSGVDGHELVAFALSDRASQHTSAVARARTVDSWVSRAREAPGGRGR